MQVAYNSVFRWLMGYEKFSSVNSMFVEDQSDNFDTCIKRLVYGFYQRLIISENSLVNVWWTALLGSHQNCMQIKLNVSVSQIVL